MILKKLLVVFMFMLAMGRLVSCDATCRNMPDGPYWGH